MTNCKEKLSQVVEKESHLHVVLGYDANYTVKGFGSTSLQLESNDLLHLNNVLYAPGMKINLVSSFALQDTGYRVTFLYGNVLAWNNNYSMNILKVISVMEDILYRFSTLLAQSLVHDSTNISELWHKD